MSLIADRKQIEQIGLVIGGTSVVLGLIKTVLLLNNRYQEKKKLPPLIPYKFPFIGSTFDFYKRPQEFTITNTKKYGSVFRMHLHGDIVTVVGAEDAEEVFNNPDLSFVESQSKFLGGAIFHASSEFTLPDNTVRDSIMKHLTPNLKIYSTRSFEQFLKDAEQKITDDEFEVPDLLLFLRKFVSKYSASAFVGLEMCEDDNLIYAFEHAVADIGREMKPSPIRVMIPLWNAIYKKFFFSKGTAIKKHRSLIKSALQEEIKRRLKNPEKTHQDLLHYLLTQYPHELDEPHLESLTTIILVFIIVGVQTTSDAVTYILYTLVQHPEYIEELREEQENALLLAEKRSIYTPEVYRHMEKLDSFMHEALRIRMTSIGLSHTNISRRNVLLRSGTVVKPGQEVYINTWHVHHQDNTTDFDGFRYVGRENPITKPGYDNIIFGMGKHACPGRWFAVHQMKGLISYFIRNYDMYPVGEIKTMHANSSHVGPPEGAIRFIKRKVQ